MNSFGVRSIRLNLDHTLKHPSIVVTPICSRMRTPVAVWAKPDHEAGIVRSAIAEPTNMMWLKIRDAVRPKERCGLAAALTISSCASHDVVAHITAALDYGALGHSPAWGFYRRRERTCAERVDIAAYLWLHLLCGFLDRLQRAQFKDDRLAHVAVAIRCLLSVIARAYHLAFEAKTCWELSKKKEIATIRQVICDRSVAAGYLHISSLSFSEILKRAVGKKPVGIAVFKSFLTCDDDYNLVSGRRDNSALLLPAEVRVNVSTPIVNPAAFESPSHCCFLPSKPSLAERLSARNYQGRPE
ncbi:hypothetical protein X756_17220 [Mesorhizobium sp. LSHC412B00]|nr:hypothetical protein X756_17220 [Mesorhizobium sp. LSHC412B00]